MCSNILIGESQGDTAFIAYMAASITATLLSWFVLHLAR